MLSWSEPLVLPNISHHLKLVSESEFQQVESKVFQVDGSEWSEGTRVEKPWSYHQTASMSLSWIMLIMKLLGTRVWRIVQEWRWRKYKERRNQPLKCNNARHAWIPRSQFCYLCVSETWPVRNLIHYKKLQKGSRPQAEISFWKREKVKNMTKMKMTCKKNFTKERQRDNKKSMGTPNGDSGSSSHRGFCDRLIIDGMHQ